MKTKIAKFVLSRKFPLFFIQLVTLLCLVCLLLALAFINKYQVDGIHFYIIAAQELIYSAVGAGSVGICAYICMNSRFKE